MLLPNDEVRLQDGRIVDAALAAALELIRERACSGLNVDDLVNATKLPRRTLERRFQKYLNSTPYAEILKVQIQSACDLLTDTHLKLKDIAERCGFHSVSHLCVAMRRCRKMTPIEVRQAGKKYDF